MSRYIDAEKISIRVPYGYNDEGVLLVPLYAVNQSIARTPTEDVAEIRHGYWIRKTNGIDFTHYICSECGHKEYIKGKNFCSECGAKMEDCIVDNTEFSE